MPWEGIGNIDAEKALIGFRGGEHHLRDQAGDEGAEQCLSAAPGVVD
jgi:hypothetical protein